MTDRILCKYYMNGICKYGDSCMFSHDKTQLPNLVCTYYLAGNCAYGDKCRYNHIKAEREKRQGFAVKTPAAPKPTPSAPSTAPTTSAPTTDPAPTPSTSAPAPNPWTGRHAATSQPLTQSKVDPTDIDWDSYDPWEQQDAASSAVTSTDPGELPICSQYSATGTCSRGDNCPLIHGDLCEICQRFCIHPYNPEVAEQHLLECTSRHERLQARLRSADVECGICLERVMAKGDPAARRFGLLSCAHPFCLPCIRNWRSTSDANPDTAVRTCPICRVTSHFVTPSSIWPASAEERQEIVERYKGRLATIDCHHFAFGDGTCAFGTSCFYRHVYRDGQPEETTLRKAGNADGEVRVVAPIKLSSFLELPTATRLLSRRS